MVINLIVNLTYTTKHIIWTLKKMLNIGILNLQGDVEEHDIMTTNAFKNMKLEGKTTLVNNLKDIYPCDGLIISGGESSTIGMHLEKTGLDKYIVQSSIPVLGTCAGLVLLSKNTNKKQSPLGLMDITVKRNAFGRQKFSFESEIKLNNKIFNGVFIRAPCVEKIGNNVKILSKFDEKIIAAKENQYIGISFHPELTDDTYIHELFIKEIQIYKKNKLG